MIPRVPSFTRIQLLDSRATDYGGGVAILASAQPIFADLNISYCRAMFGGGVYAEGTATSTFEPVQVSGEYRVGRESTR